MVDNTPTRMSANDQDRLLKLVELYGAIEVIRVMAIISHGLGMPRAFAKLDKGIHGVN